MYSHGMDCVEDAAFNSFLFCADLLPWKHVLDVVEPCLGCLCLAVDDFSALLLQYFML
jgi:hypothetical protein